jgi:hypothetical protein
MTALKTLSPAEARRLGQSPARRAAIWFCADNKRPSHTGTGSPSVTSANSGPVGPSPSSSSARVRASTRCRSSASATAAAACWLTRSPPAARCPDPGRGSRRGTSWAGRPAKPPRAFTGPGLRTDSSAMFCVSFSDAGPPP